MQEINILVVSSNYPNSAALQKGTFVYKVVQQFTKHNKIIVISPQRKRFNNNYLSKGYGQELAKVYRPTHWSFSNKTILKWNTYALTSFLQARAIEKTVIKNHICPDVVYCHFISSALLYLTAFPNSTKPLFVAVGEYKNIETVKSYYKNSVYFKMLQKITGFIAVSLQIKTKLLELGVEESKILLAPNGTDLTRFKPRNKLRLREKYKFPLDKKIVLFVGRFLHNKGPLRVLEAINQIDDDICLIFIGKGPQKIESQNIIYQGSVPHHQVAEYMALADVFILPTLHEGSSNVIIEAMASGLPIVSSAIPEIRMQCDSSFSRLVDPMNVRRLKEAVEEIVNDEILRKRMSENALNKAKDFDLSLRVKNILEFIRVKSSF